LIPAGLINGRFVSIRKHSGDPSNHSQCRPGEQAKAQTTGTLRLCLILYYCKTIKLVVYNCTMHWHIFVCMYFVHFTACRVSVVVGSKDNWCYRKGRLRSHECLRLFNESYHRSRWIRRANQCFIELPHRRSLFFRCPHKLLVS